MKAAVCDTWQSRKVESWPAYPRRPLPKRTYGRSSMQPRITCKGNVAHDVLRLGAVAFMLTALGIALTLIHKNLQVAIRFR